MKIYEDEYYELDAMISDLEISCTILNDNELCKTFYIERMHKNGKNYNDEWLIQVSIDRAKEYIEVLKKYDLDYKDINKLNKGD